VKIRDKLAELMQNEDHVNNLEKELAVILQAIEDYKKNIGETEVKIREISARGDQPKKRHSELMKRKQELTTELNQLKKEKGECEHSMTILRRDVGNMIERNTRKENLRKTIVDKIAALEDQLRENQETCEREKCHYNKPSEFDDPPSNLMRTDVIVEEKGRTERRIQEMQEDFNRAILEFGNVSEVDLQQLYQSEKIEVERWKEKVRYWKGIVSAISDCTKIQVTEHDVRKNALPRRIQEVFKELMLMHPSGTYCGELQFDLENKRITPKVSTRGERMDEGEVPQSDRAKKKRAADELSQLSGGEKSFGTACFVMSLWKCVVEAPFRLMDEFDIFMDNNNRRRIMEMLCDIAKDEPSKQFIFFTPQGIKEMKRDDIQVFTLTKDQGNARAA